MGKSLREKRVEFTKNSIELHTTDKGIWQYLSDKYSNSISSSFKETISTRRFLQNSSIRRLLSTPYAMYAPEYCTDSVCSRRHVLLESSINRMNMKLHGLIEPLQEVSKPLHRDSAHVKPYRPISYTPGSSNFTTELAPL
jgi:hypothetical protein